LPKTEAKEGR